MTMQTFDPAKDTFDPTKVVWVWDNAGVARLIAVLEGFDWCSWDLETTGLDEWHPRAKITLCSITLPNDDTWLVPLYHPESPFLGVWRTIYRRIAMRLLKMRLVPHNGKFDARWTNRHTGVDLSNSLWWDTQISSHLIDENRRTRLKVRVSQDFGVPEWDDFDLSHDEAALKVPLIDLGLYAARDTYWTKKLAEAHMERMFQTEDADEPYDDDEIEEARLGRLMKWVGMPTVRTMTRIEQRGIPLDVPFVDNTIAKDQEVVDSTREWLRNLYQPDPHSHGEDEACPKDCPHRKLAGGPSFAATSHWFRAWTGKAVEAGDLRVQSMTKNGNPQWNKSVLVRQARGGSKVATELLRHRASVKRLEYLHSWRHYVKEDGRIHATYNVGRLITGRLSSEGPNMQQITKPLRPCYVPPEGFVIADFDYSQLELRVAAFIARCAAMIQAFKEHRDLHRMIAARITGKDPENVTADERQGGKAGNFGFLFGQSAYGFKFYAENTYGLSFTDEECQAIYNAFFAEWEGMAEWHQDVLRRAYRTGQVVSPIGRVRRLPSLYSADEGRVKHAENAALNAPVQGFGSDLMQIAGALVEGTLPGYDPVEGVQLVATVHDSIVALLPEDDWERTAREVIDRMTQGVLPILAKMDCNFDVPLAAEATIGTRWGLKDVGEVAA